MVHLLNPMADSCGGSEWRTISLFEVLADHGPVTLWALAPHRAFFGMAPMRLPDRAREIVPHGGTLVIVGCYYEMPPWLAKGDFERVVLVYNVLNRQHLRHALEALRRMGIEAVEFVAASNELRVDLVEQGLECSCVQPSWIDIDRFRPLAQAPARPFTVGRMSRDVPEKFHSGDPELFVRLADEGFKLRIMGGTCLRDRIAAGMSIELLPQGAEPAPSFLQSLDALVYRTSEHWFESFGRSVFEGLACGVVPVAHRHGGYAEYIRHEVNGYLFETDDEAVGYLRRLRGDPALRAGMALEARNSMEKLYGDSYRRETVGFYFCSAG